MPYLVWMRGVGHHTYPQKWLERPLTNDGKVWPGVLKVYEITPEEFDKRATINTLKEKYPPPDVEDN